MDKIDIFERLKNGETILSNDPQGYRMREASYNTKTLLVKMNNSADPAEIRNLLSQITDTAINDSVAVSPPYTSITESIRRLVKTCLSISTVPF